MSFHGDGALQEAVEAIKNGATEIDLKSNEIGYEGATALANALANNESLHMLDLEKNNIGDEGATALANALANNESLQALYLEKNNIGVEGATALANALANNESLHMLDLVDNKIGDEGATTLANALANNESLHTLDLGGDSIGDEGATALANALANNESLHTLGLVDNDIGHEGASALANALVKNESLQTLDLCYNNISHEGASALANALANNESLQSLDLQENNIGDEGATALANALANNESLQSLDLGGNNIGDEGVSALANALASNESLHTLDLDDNEIDDEGASALANALAKNKSLRTLDLGDNNIGDEGAAALANALASNESLQTLNLSGNNIGDEGVTALANALANNESLHTLGLSYNNIGDEGAAALANALANNESLQTLNLESNNIGDEGVTTLANALANNGSLQTLDLDDNEIDDEGATALVNALAENKTLQELDINHYNPALKAALERNQTLYEQSQTPLMQACKNGDISEAEKLVVSGARIDTRDTLGQTALFHVCEAQDENNALLLAKLLFKYSAGLSSESLGIRKAINHASSEHYTELSAFLSFIHSLPLAQLQTNALRMLVVSLFDQGVQTLEEFCRLNSVLLSAQDRRALHQAFADTERAPDLKVRNATDQTNNLGALATEVSLARTKRGEDKAYLHPRLHHVFAEQLSRKNPVAFFADFERQQIILREKAHELAALQEAVKTDLEKVPERDEARRDLVTGIRKALSGGIESQLETLLADPVTKDAVDSCHSLWKDILDDPVAVDDAVAQVTFEQMQEVTQAAVEALKAWETRHDTSAARKHTEAAIDALDESTKRLGIQPTYFMTLRHPERTNELATELETVQQAFEAELSVLTNVNPMADAPLEDVRRALSISISFYTRTVASEVSRLQTCVNELTTLLSLHVPGLTAPSTSRVADIMQNLRQSRRRRERLEHDLRYAREDANDGDTEAQARIPGLEQELAQIGSVYRLDSELRNERARMLRHAEEHYPELLCDQNWIRSLGMNANVPRELSSLGLWLTNAKRGDFETIAELASKPGKSVFKVRDLDGRDFVLKSFHLANEEWSSRFYRQVAALAQIKSAYIVRIQGVFMQDAHHGCTLMPCYSGGDLSAWIRDNPNADVATRRRIAIGLLSGLHDLHSQGFVHCDVKPENVYLAAGLSPVLGDFDGVQMHDVTMTQPVQTTFKYMAPELRDGNANKVESAVDLFSAGMALADLYEGSDIPDAMQSLISSLRSADPRQRPTALQALRHKAFQVEPVKAASCAICLDVYPVSEGVSCADGHFTCKECLSMSVRAAAQAQSHVKVLRDGSMCCVAPDCDLVILGRSIAATVPDEDFAALLGIVRTHFERDAAAEQERQLQDRVDAALREHGLDPTTQNHIRTIQNEVLAMSCPRCSTVFADFDGCCALKCAVCPCYFCAWCLQDTGDDTNACHRHVARCASKPDDEEDPFFSDFAVVQQAWARLRAQQLHRYMVEEIEDPGLRANVQQRLRPLLTPDIVGDNFNFS